LSPFFIITGIGLDYDIFLLVRVTELRGKGLDPQTAIQEGLVSTGGIITAAGMVMVFAFAGMLFSDLITANTYGFMMCVAILFDTFIARSIVNPALMSLLGYWNWWPSNLSKPAGSDKRFVNALEVDEEGDNESENESCGSEESLTGHTGCYT